jgi:hypothetical protein
MRYLEHVARMEEKRIVTSIWLESLKEKGYWEDTRSLENNIKIDLKEIV